jgi:signal peptidase I
MKIKVGQLLSAIVTLVLVGGGWFFLAPTQLGGSTAYVQTYGTSMEPHYHAGDLAIVRSAGSYHVGEIVAYRNAQLGDKIVLHRIIRIADGHYYFKGDNNNFVDSYQPTRSGLVGHLWLHIPSAGRYLVWLHGAHLFLVGGLGMLAILLLGAGAGGKRVRARRQLRPAQERAFSFGALPIGAGVLALAFGGLAALSYNRPLATHAVQPGLYTQTGRFSYDAAAPNGAAVYGSTTVTTGQPIFLRLVHTVDFNFAYSFGSSAPHGAAGTIALDAQIVGSNGWKRTLELVAPTAFTGDHARVTGAVNLPSLTKLTERVDALSAVNGGTYTLTLLPKVQVHGIAGGNAIHDSFAPKLPLMLDPHQLQLQPGTVTGAGAASTLTQSASGSGTTTVGNRLSVLKFKLPVALAREISLYGGAAAVLLLLIGIAAGLRTKPRAEDAEIARLYGELIVPVDGLPAEAASKLIRTSDMEGLARIADQAAKMIMHAERAGRHTYFVEDDGVRYVYEHGAATAATTEPSLRLAKGA